eukprot:TRINITY_DN12995_c0_g1_i1.p1 TRINITY_DN12995_c0_g1~~TRINITY_DN12995_c0_g1_i1.p1  ORF type:complete len:846 (+),score=84.53 TRINITY_DN12995_c0_g1_i1:236-2773(+)
MLYLTTSHRCVHSFIVSGPFETNTPITVERVESLTTAGHYVWAKVAESTTEESGTTILLPEHVCASSWRLTSSTSQNGSPWKDITMMVKSHTTRVGERRAISCDTPDIYPPECGSASEGAKCLGSLVCGCDVDRDCFPNNDFPYCNVDTHQCERCTFLAPGGNSYNDHYFCRTRYPGYDAQPTTKDRLPSELAAPQNFYREVCIRAPQDAAGACQRCSQAPLQSQFKFPTQPSNEGASGTFFCNQIRPTKPICMDLQYHKDIGRTDLFDVNLRGACVPCNTSAQCARALPSTPVCEPTDGGCHACKTNLGCVGTGGNNCQADGTCVSCTSNEQCGANDGGETTNSPICDTSTGICGVCQTNAQCTGTPGANCQEDGSCQNCQSDADCGNKDGGESKGQPLCDTNTHICISLCQSNDDCSQGNLGNNCQKDGRCLTCKSDTDCVDDGGQQPGQSQCDTTTGICVTPFVCSNNAECVGHGGANCQADGSCINCTPKTCGPLDKDNQPNCDSTSRLCIDACKTNDDCKNTDGANCETSGLCLSCTSDADCGANDGGEQPGQEICDVVTGLCGPCRSNDDCKGAQRNCGSDGKCFNCSNPEVSCSEVDGPPGQPKQPNCDAKTGICISGCTQNSHCVDECLPFCDTDKHCCTECLQNSDCPHAGWEGAALKMTVCSALTHSCISGCNVDADCPTEALPGCSPLGHCVECVSDSHCTGGDNPVCDTATGKCVTCTRDADCIEDSKNACSLNQQKCVACQVDSHCSKDLVCLVSEERCVQCVFDYHCGSNHFCGDDKVCIKGSRGNLTVGALVGIGIASFIVLLLILIVIWLMIKVNRLSRDGERQPLGRV